MRSVLALGLLITLCASANAATVHRPKPPGVHLRTRERVTIRPGQRITAPAHFAVPGWTNEQTQYRLDKRPDAVRAGQRHRRRWLRLIDGNFAPRALGGVDSKDSHLAGSMIQDC